MIGNIYKIMKFELDVNLEGGGQINKKFSKRGNRNKSSYPVQLLPYPQL
jgi:hypothetical protein